MATANSKDIKIVQANWRAVATDITGLGVDTFVALFNGNNDYADLFEGIRISGDFDVSNPKMREHCLRIMSALGSWIWTLSDGPVIDGLLTLQGKEHKARRIGETHFKAVQPCLFNAIEKRIGDAFNRQAWTNVFNFIIFGLGKGWNV